MAGIEKLAILDLEGTDLPDDSGILEVHVRIVDLKTLKQEASFWAIPELPEGARPLNAFTTKMHEANGLLRRRDTRGLGICQTRKPAPGSTPVDAMTLWSSTWRLPDVQLVADSLADFLKHHHGEDGPRSMLLAGNSLANYDIPLLRRWMPKVLTALHYRTYDVSVVRTHYREVLGQPLPARIEAQITGTGDASHRAGDDTGVCLRTIRQLRAWAAERPGAPPLTVSGAEPSPSTHGWGDDWSDPLDAVSRH